MHYMFPVFLYPGYPLHVSSQFHKSIIFSKDFCYHNYFLLHNPCNYYGFSIIYFNNSWWSAQNASGTFLGTRVKMMKTDTIPVFIDSIWMNQTLVNTQ